MSDLRALAETIGGLFKKRATAFYWASLVIKIVFIIGGSLAVAVAQAMQIPVGESWSIWQAVVVAAAVLVAVGGIFITLTDSDASAALEAARKAVEEARELEEVMLDFDSFEREQDRTVELYAAMSAMRGVIEQALLSPTANEVSTIETLLTAAKRSMLVALGFEQADRWTVCIYKADHSGKANGAGTMLRCVAHARSIECDIAAARSWPEGVGVGGVSYANRKEVIVPDMLAPQLGTIFDIGAKKREYDDDRYRSVVSVPILVGPSDEPWGVVVATSDRPNHFSPRQRPGLGTVEGVRALAGMTALAIGIYAKPQSDTKVKTDAPAHLQQPATTH